MSSRMRKQVSFLNRLYEWARFFGRIIIFDIPGKKAAREIETRYIKDYEEKHAENLKAMLDIKKTANNRLPKMLPKPRIFVYPTVW